MTACGSFLTGNHTQQGCFASAVLTDQSNTITLVDKERNPCQYRLGTILLYYVLDG
jgi:hypothetical protein